MSASIFDREKADSAEIMMHKCAPVVWVFNSLNEISRGYSNTFLNRDPKSTSLFPWILPKVMSMFYLFHK